MGDIITCRFCGFEKETLCCPNCGNWEPDEECLTNNDNHVIGAASFLLLWADSPRVTAGLETVVGKTQAEIVDDFIETTCWRENPRLAAFIGGKGTLKERLAAIRTAFEAEGSRPF